MNDQTIPSLIKFGKILEIKPEGEWQGKRTKASIVMLCAVGDGEVRKDYVTIEDGDYAPNGVMVGEVQGLAIKQYATSQRKIGNVLLADWPVFPAPSISK